MRANWPAQIKPGSVADTPIHVVDVYPTLARLAGASTSKSKPLDGMDVWPALGQAAASPRTEVVYGIEPFRGAVRTGDWKLAWQATLPSQVELFDLAQDPGETTNLADKNPDKVAALQKRIETQAREAVPPLILKEALGVIKPALSGSVAFPAEANVVEQQP